MLKLLTFVGQARRLGLTLSEIKHIVVLRRSGSAPCAHLRALLEQKAADLCTACPEVVVDGDTIRIGEDANTAVLKKDEWNVSST